MKTSDTSEIIIFDLNDFHGIRVYANVGWIYVIVRHSGSDCFFKLSCKPEADGSDLLINNFKEILTFVIP